MALVNGYEEYKLQKVLTASPGDLILMLYDGALKQLRTAKFALSGHSVEEANEALKKSQDIINELIMSLDVKLEIANDLMRLYDFILREIIDINIHKDENRIEDVIGLLSDLRDTWEKVIQQNRTNVYSIGE